MDTPAHQGGRTSARIGSAVLLVFALLYGFEASRITYAFSSDPLGPKVFPLGLAAVLAGLAIYQLIRPAPGDAWPRGRLLASLVAIPALVAAATFLLEPAGFVVAVLVLVTGVGRIFGASWRLAILGGVLQAALWYLVFGYLLEVYLPMGTMFGR
jgi:putative tricarboxylic transport membrane protein